MGSYEMTFNAKTGKYFGLLCLWLLLGIAPAKAGDILAEWGTVQPPAAPAPSAVTVDPASTALLILDMSGAQNPKKGPCNTVTKPRCIASIPAVAALIGAARQHGVFVVYSVTSVGSRGDIATMLAPLASDPVVKAGPDKFVRTNLAQILEQKNIKTVIILGTAAEGAVLDTATDAVLREHLHVIVPVDGMTSTTLYPEQFVSWQLLNAPGLAGMVKLTRSGMIGY
jgi:nicotinamidase-related amidase